MGLRLFTVTVETDLVVLAEDDADAEEIALRVAQDADEWDATVWHHVELPHGWDANCIPYGDGDPDAPDRTIGEWLTILAPKDGIE